MSLQSSIVPTFPLNLIKTDAEEHN